MTWLEFLAATLLGASAVCLLLFLAAARAGRGGDE